MAYLVYRTDTKQMVGDAGRYHFQSEAAAKACRTRCINKGVVGFDTDLAVTTVTDYEENIRTTRTVKNLMSGKDVEIDVNTPRCCDPSSELYWSM